MTAVARVIIVLGLTLAVQSRALPLKAALCTEGGQTALCGYRQPEDVVRVPGTPWVLASSTAKPGGLSIIDTRDKSGLRLFPSSDATVRHDRKLYAQCPGPPAADDEFAIAGLAVRPGPKSIVYAIHLRTRLAVEVFELDTRGDRPKVTWVGCAPTPEGLGLNSVAPLPGGGFVASKMLTRTANMEIAFEQARKGELTGEVWQWSPKTAWAKVPGSETSGANGIVASKDGKSIYVVGWGNKTFMQLSLGRRPPLRRDITLPFRLDNIHWAEDGSILGVGQAETSAGGTTKIVKIDPRTLRVSDVIETLDTPFFGMGSAAVEVGDELWVGSPRRDRIGIFPRPSTANSR